METLLIVGAIVIVSVAASLIVNAKSPKYLICSIITALMAVGFGLYIYFSIDTFRTFEELKLTGILGASLIVIVSVAMNLLLGRGEKTTVGVAAKQAANVAAQKDDKTRAKQALKKEKADRREDDIAQKRSVRREAQPDKNKATQSVRAALVHDADISEFELDKMIDNAASATENQVPSVDDEAARAKAERLEAERLEAERLERERAERAEAERIAAERVEAERMERERAERAEAERLAVERMERERAERAEVERVEVERLEAERIEAECLERERAERAEVERVEAERVEAERIAAERLERERIEKAEGERAEAERIEAERLERERIEKAEAERLEAERLEQQVKRNEFANIKLAAKAKDYKRATDLAVKYLTAHAGELNDEEKQSIKMLMKLMRR